MDYVSFRFKNDLVEINDNDSITELLSIPETIQYEANI